MIYIKKCMLAVFVRQITCPVFSVVPLLARLRSRDEIFRVSVVTAISDMKNALVGEGVEVATPTDWNSVKRLS